MPRETIAAVKEQMQVELNKCDAKFRDVENQLIRAEASLVAAKTAYQKANDTERAYQQNVSELQEHRATLRGYILAKLPLTIADLPAGLRDALGIQVWE